MRRSLPSLQSLIVLEVAARYENFSRAAEELNLTQGAVSRQIRTLEDFVGEPLFARAKRRIHLTESGDRLARETAPLLDALETVFDTLRRTGGARHGVAIATYPTFARRWLVPTLARLERMHGRIDVDVTTVISNAACNPDVVDFAILQGAEPWQGLDADWLMPEELVVAGAPEFDMPGDPSIERLATHPFVRVSSRPVSFRIWSDSAGRPHPDPAPWRVFDLYGEMIEAAIAGAGIAVFPKVLVERELTAGLLRQLHPHVARPEAGYHIVRSPRRARSVAAVRLAELLSDCARGDVPEREKAAPR